MQLKSLQEQFTAYLLVESPEISSNIVALGPPGLHDISTSLCKADNSDRFTRLKIYFDAYRLRLIEALKDNYPALHTILGDEQFASLCTDYLKHHPSRHFSIRYFGHALPDFLAGFPPYSGQVALKELALFEWTLRDVFDAADDHSLTMEELQQIPLPNWPEISFRFHPSLRRIQLSTNAVQIWKAIQEQQENIVPESVNSPVEWILWRQNLNSYFKPLDLADSLALTALMEGQNFTQVCDILCQILDADNAAVGAARLIQQCVRDGLMSASLFPRTVK